MATVQPTRPALPGIDPSSVQVYQWILTATDDVGAPVTIPRSADRSFDVYATALDDDFDGATIYIEGGNHPTAPNYKTINDSRGEGSPLAFTAGDLRQALEVATVLRPRKSGGARAITVVLTAVRK